MAGSYFNMYHPMPTHNYRGILAQSTGNTYIDVLEPLNINELHRKGLSKHNEGKFNEAIDLFKQALDLCKTTDFNAAIIMQDKASSHLQNKDYINALKDAKNSMTKQNNTMDIHVIAGKALVGLERYWEAFNEYLCAYRSVGLLGKCRTSEVLYELTSLFSLLPETLYNHFRNSTLSHVRWQRNVWAKVCYQHVRNKEWKAASAAYFQFKNNSQTPVDSTKLDLTQFCSLKDIRCHRWVAPIILHLLECGSDKAQLSMEEGDTYLHAAVRIALVAGYPQLLQYLIAKESESAIVRQPIEDGHGNTLLHSATKERNVDKRDRYTVMTLVLEFGVDPQARNNEGKQAISNLADKKCKELIRKFYKTNENEVKEQQMERDDHAVLVNRADRQYDKKIRRNKKSKKGKEPVSTCNECQHIYDQAIIKLQESVIDGMNLLTKLFNIDHNNKKHTDIVQSALKEFVDYMGTLGENDIQSCMEGLCKEKYAMIIESLAEHRKWMALDVILRKANSLLDAKAVRDFSPNLSLDLYLESIAQIDEADNIRIINNLLNCGWSLGKDNGQTFIKTVVDQKQFKLFFELLKYDIDLSHLSVYEGDTPIHAAVQIALQEKQPSILRVLIERHRSDKVVWAHLDPEQVDVNGDCVYHLLTKSDDNELVLQLAKIFYDMGVSSNYKNKKMKYPHDDLNPKFTNVLNFLKKGNAIECSNNQVKCTEKKSYIRTSLNSETEVGQKRPSKYQSVKLLSEQQDEIKGRIKILITSLQSKSEKRLPLTKLDRTDFLSYGESHQTTREGFKKKNLEDIAQTARFALKEDQSSDNETESETMNEDNNDFSDLPPLESEGDPIQGANHIIDGDEPMPKCNDTDKSSDSEEDKTDIDDTLDLKDSFDGLTWEVEYTDKVRKQLTRKGIEPHLRRRIMRIIRRLANGDWQNNYCKKLKIESNSIELLEVKLSKGSRIIWEKAINFSPRFNEYTVPCSDPSTENASDVHGHKLYTEVIRIWDIVIDHDKLERSVNNIVNAHRRGEGCLTRRNLKGLSSNKECREENELKYPLQFTQRDSQDDSTFDNQIQTFFPPASPNKKEYNILKFYTWDEAFERYVMHNSNADVEFPFKVTEKEDAIIRIADKGPILLLGRSGTGKTTCCLFRLWNELKNHMEPKIVKDHEEPCEDQAEEQLDDREGCGEEDKDANTNFHQLFLTKNQVLVAEVKKTFSGFLESNEALQANRSEGLDKKLPNSFKDVRDESFPLFLTSRQFLCKLDASIENHFFSRKDDGSLKFSVEGWVDDEHVPALDAIGVDSDDEELDDTDDIEAFIPEEKMGSYESLYTSCGYISKDEYMKLGMKRAPNFTGDREVVYMLFELYERVKKQRRMFDETDVVFDISKRLNDMEACPITLHQIYVDEAQDFTQAELFLVTRLCQNPNNMFLTGDTAQSIMRGISFRFEDLKCLFYHIHEVFEKRKKENPSLKLTNQTVHVPKKVHKLIYNYRSHSGIVSLASSILDILGYFFRESFDLLDPEKGLLPGPEPILIESCTFTDLAVLLRGNKRKTSTIEFGAHQVVLVYDEEARECLPEELTCGLVLTIYEAKGLEFDDVLLYNFFKDSQASDEWRVVTQYLNDLSTRDKEKMYQHNKASVVVDQDVLTLQNRPRPLHFDPNQHKILGSELKLLYTALTRARVNVWIFDEDLEKRKPIFEYFEARKLVNFVRSCDFTEERLPETIFENSNDEDWINLGDYFMKKRLYGAAAKCFCRGGHQYNQMLAQGHEHALLASRKRFKTSESKQMKTEFLFAAEMYMKCGHYLDTEKCLNMKCEHHLDVAKCLNKKCGHHLDTANSLTIKCGHYLDAAKCLNNAKEVELAITLYDRLGMFEKAASVCRKHKQYLESSKFYERSCNYNKAVSVLFDNQLYGHAFNVFNKCMTCEKTMEETRNILPEEQSLKNPNASFTEEKICKRAAEEFHKFNKKEDMYKAVSRFHRKSDIIEFYKSNGYISDAAKELLSTGRLPDAVDLYLKHGKLTDALDVAEKFKNDKEIATCLLILSRDAISSQEMQNEKNEQEEDRLKGNLEKALSFFENVEDKNSAGQVKLLQAQLYRGDRYVFSAAEYFTHWRFNPNKEGYLECCIGLIPYLDNSNQVVNFLLKGADFLFDVCKSLLMKDHKSCEFYGMHSVSREGKASFVVYPRKNPLCAKMLPKVRQSCAVEVRLLDKDIQQMVMSLLEICTPWTEYLKNSLLHRRSSIINEITENDTETKSDELAYAIEQVITANLPLAEYEFFINKRDKVLREYRAEDKKKFEKRILSLTSCFNIKADEKFETCEFVLKIFVQQPSHPLFLTDKTNEIFVRTMRNNYIFKAHMRTFFSRRFTDSYRYLTEGMPDEAFRNYFQQNVSNPSRQLLGLEFYSTLAFFLTAKIKSNEEMEFISFLPNNYVALLHFVESTLCQKQPFSILQSISLWKTPGEIDFFECVSKFASSKISQMETEILKITDNENKIVLSERLYILINTILCNLGNCAPSTFSCYKKLVKFARKIQKKHERITFTSGDQQFKSIKDVAKHLQDFFVTRRMGEMIQSIRWNPQQPDMYTASPIDIQKMPTETLEEMHRKAEDQMNNSPVNKIAAPPTSFDASVTAETSEDWPMLGETKGSEDTKSRNSENINKSTEDKVNNKTVMAVTNCKTDKKDNNENKNENDVDTQVNKEASEWPELVAPYNKSIEKNESGSSKVNNESLPAKQKTQAFVPKITTSLFINRDLQEDGTTKTCNDLTDNCLEAQKNNATDDNMKAYVDSSVETAFNEVLASSRDCGICGVPFVTFEIGNTDEVRVESNSSHLKENDYQENAIKDEDNSVNSDVSRRKQEHEREETHMNNMKTFKEFETAYNEYYKPVICKVNEFLQNPRFNLYENKYISTHFDKYKDEIQRMVTNNDTLQTSILNTLRENTWNADKGVMHEIADTLKYDLAVVHPYVIEVTDKLLNGSNFCASERTGNAAGKVDDDDTNYFEPVALEPVKRKKYMSQKERRDKKRHSGKKK